MSYEYKLKLILLANHIALVLGLLYADWTWLTLSFVGWILFGKVGGEIALHRYLCHNSFKTGWIRHRLLIALSVFNCFGSPVAWCGIHRKHHAKSEGPDDPHGAQSGWRIWSTFWEPFTIERRYVVDLVRDPTIKLVHKHYLKILLTSYAVLAVIDWRIAVFLISVPATLTFHSAGLVNVFCHKWGYRHYDTPDHSTNNTWINLLTLGSGLHNTHHAKPTAWDNRVKWWEIDLPALIIKYVFINEHKT